MRQKKLVITLLVLLAFVVSGFTYAYWASSIVGDSESDAVSINIGTGSTVNTTVSFGGGTHTGADALVPAGYEGTNKVSYKLLTYTVTWDEEDGAAGALSTLAVAITSLQVNSGADTYGKVAVSYQIGGSAPVDYTVDLANTVAQSIANGASLTVYVLVRLEEPENVTQYNFYASQEITFSVDFTIA